VKLGLSHWENRVMRKILELKRKEVTGDWKRLYNEEHRDLYTSPHIMH
jgi:hypothetical protein